MAYGVVDIPSEWCKGAPPDQDPGNPASGESPTTITIGQPTHSGPYPLWPGQSRASYAQTVQRKEGVRV